MKIFAYVPHFPTQPTSPLVPLLRNKELITIILCEKCEIVKEVQQSKAFYSDGESHKTLKYIYLI